MSMDLDHTRAQLQRMAEILGRLAPDDGPAESYREALHAARSGDGLDELGRDEQERRSLGVQLAIVKAALKSERQQVAELRAQVEEMQAALVANRNWAEALRGDRDRWAERARLLALPLFQEHAEADEGAEHAADTAEPRGAPRHLKSVA